MSQGDFSSLDKVESKSEDEINPKLLFNTLKRNKNIVFGFSLSGLILSGLIAFTAKKTWQGEFQIVLENQSNSSSNIESKLKLAEIVGISPGSNTLATEVEILKSPSVLMSVFEFVKTKKNLQASSKFNMRFVDWKKKLDVNLEKGTSVLSLTYSDTDKDLILPVLNKISKTYQDYSEKKRKREVELGMSFFEEQISLYEKKRGKSFKEAQQFAIDQDLTFREDLTVRDGIFIPIDIENRRVKAANEIRLINEKLAQVKLLKNPYKIIYQASTTEGFTDLSNKLKTIDRELSSKRQVYTENDLEIKNLLKKRDNLNKLVKTQVIGILEAKKEEAKAIVKASERPEGVLVEYRNLLLNTSKDKQILDSLENQYRALSLEKARYTDPWELITKPELLPYPIAPIKKRILALGLLISFFAGCGVSIVLEKSKNIIFSLEEIKSIFRGQLLDSLSFKNRDLWEESLELLAKGPLSSTEGSIALTILGDINEVDIQQINSFLKKNLNGRKLIITNDILIATKSSSILLIVALGITTKKRLIEVCNKLAQQNNQLLGVLVLN